MSQHESRGDAQHESSPAGTASNTELAARQRSGRPWYTRIACWIGWSSFALIFAGVLLGIAFFAATLHPVILPPLPSAPSLVYSSDGLPMAQIFNEVSLPVKLADVPMHTIYAVLAAEDAHFFEHNGLDWHGLLRAGWVNLQSFHFSQQSRTITQQLVRMNLLTGRPSLWRDVREGILAVRLERAYDKYTLLERYLNTVYFGSGVYGIGAAAKFYFNKPVNQLTPAESAVLAGLISSPGEGNPRDNVQIPRQRAILAAMQRHQWLSPEDYADAVSETLVIQPQRVTPWPHPYVVDAVRQQLMARYGQDVVYQQGLAVYTTIDPRLQYAAEKALSDAINAGKALHVSTGALAAIEPHTGAIRALVGGVNYQQSQYNRALLAHRQAGSAFKVFVYQAAIDNGHFLYEQALDAPVTVDGWTPKNLGDHYLGMVNLRTALAQSLTSVAVRLTQELTPPAVAAAAHRSGITGPLPADASIVLGNAEVTPLQMAQVFATYANDGASIEPSLITEIRLGNRVLFRQQPVVRQSVDPATAFLLTQGLKQVLLQGTGKHADLGQPAAGMPGASSDAGDAWFIGYTPNLSTAVWLGNDDHRPMLGVEGETLPAQAWSAFMHQAHLGLPISDFSVPAQVKLVSLCADSHQLALPVCPHAGAGISAGSAHPRPLPAALLGHAAHLRGIRKTGHTSLPGDRRAHFPL